MPEHVIEHGNVSYTHLQKDASEKGWRDLLKEARSWLAACPRLAPGPVGGEMPHLQKEPAAVIAQPAREGLSLIHISTGV